MAEVADVAEEGPSTGKSCLVTISGEPVTSATMSTDELELADPESTPPAPQEEDSPGEATLRSSTISGVDRRRQKSANGRSGSVEVLFEQKPVR